MGALWGHCGGTVGALWAHCGPTCAGDEQYQHTCRYLHAMNEQRPLFHKRHGSGLGRRRGWGMAACKGGRVAGNVVVWAWLLAKVGGLLVMW